MSGTVWIGLFILLSTLILEIVRPNMIKEGFDSLTPKKVDPLQSIKTILHPRGDIGVNREIGGIEQDLRYWSGYVNIQRFNVQSDFCRMVTKDGTDKGLFYACALGGTTGNNTTDYSTETVRTGFKISRDEYMRDVAKEGRDWYCRIIRGKDKSYQPLCRRSTDIGFGRIDELDTNPPEDILTLVDFYAGCELWLRLRDDMVDYIDGRAFVQVAGGITLDPTPRPTITRGLTFNGIDQFVRFGDTQELSLGNRIAMRSIRAFSVWVKFDAFTNNAHIFDFGDGPGQNNTFLGILGTGESSEDPNAIRPGAKCPETTIPTEKSGAQFCPEIRAQTLYETSAADVEKWDCKGPDTLARKIAPIQTRPVKQKGPTDRATLIYEVWDKRLRKVQVKINRAIPINTWTHILITATNMDAMRPNLSFIINGNLVYTQEQGYLPQARVTSNNYLGKSNWTNDYSGYELRDELFKGSMFDFRMYSSPVSETKGKRILQWGLGMLGLDSGYSTSASVN
jgi:hypothetical protein